MINEYITLDELVADAYPKDVIRFPSGITLHSRMLWQGKPLLCKGDYFLVFNKCDYCRTEKYPVMDDFNGWMCSRCGAPV